MGVLTDDMTRLHHKVKALHHERKTLIKSLAHGAKQRRHAVALMQSGFRKAHADITGHAGTERRKHLMGQKQFVAQLRSEFAADLAGAHQAWFGKHA